MMLQDGSLLDFPRSPTKGPLGKKMVIKAKELEPCKAMESRCVLVGERP